MIQRREFWTYVLLSFVTCGIYSIYFWYKCSEDVNRICLGDGDETMNFILAWLLGIVTCGIFLIIWYYKLGNRLQMAGQKYGIAIQENGTTVILWKVLGMFVCSVLSYYADYILIKNVNVLAEKYNANNFTNNFANQA